MSISRMSRGPAILAIAAVGLISAACRERSQAQASPAPLPDIVLITVDTLRADALGYAGNSRVATPNIDRLAREGRVFTQAHAHNVMTLPSHANILTGRLPYEHGIRDNEGFRLDSKIPTLATLLHGAGYATGAAIGAFPLDARFGLDRGFDLYDEKYPQGANEYDFRVAERPASEVIAVARRWYAGNAGRPRFLFVHLYDCHSPHVAPAHLAAAYASAPYLGEVAGVDEALGPLLEDLRASRLPTLLVFTSDHGEALGDHGEETHGLFAYEATLHVPLILWGPALVSPGRDESLRGHVDILPTVLAQARAALPSGLSGHSLLAAGNPASGSYFEALSASITRGWAPLRGVVRDGTKFVDLPIPELYDLRSDPKEEHNLALERRDAVRSLKALLPKAVAPSALPESVETVANLRRIGYLSGAGAPKKTFGPEDDPKKLVSLDADLQRVVALYQGGHLSEAIRLARNVSQRRPTMPVLYEFLSYLEDQDGQAARAIATLEEAQRRGFLDERLTTRLGLLYSQTGDPRKGLALLEPLHDSRNPDALNALGIARASAGRTERAIEAFGQALRIDPKNAVAWQNIGLTHVHANRPEEALRAFDQAFAVNDRLPRGWNGRGAALEQMGRHAEAIESWKRAVELDPQQFEALLNLGTVAMEHGDRELARQALAQFAATAPPALFAADIARARRLLKQGVSSGDRRAS
jgi:arylsulfatase A-like enzyme/Flp pilus assembly protein TadD